MKKPHPVEEFERSIIASAAYFTAFLQIRPGDRINEARPTRAEAEGIAQALADEHRRAALVYAVTAEGRQALAGTFNPRKKDSPEMKTTTSEAPKGPKKAAAKDGAPTAGRRRPAPTAAAPPPARMRKSAQAAAEAASAGTLPSPPDFSAETHKRFRPKLAELQALVAAKDIAGLKAYPINPVSTSPKALDRFRNLSVVALEAQAASEIV